MSTDSTHQATENKLPVVAGRDRTGSVIVEELQVQALDDQQYRLLVSPAFANNLAKGDTFILTGAGEYRVIERSGNLCVRVLSREGINSIKEKILAEVEKLGGQLDLETARQLVFSIHYSCGFQAIETLFDRFVPSNEASFWHYSNVYSEDGKTPLNWWKDLDQS